MEGLGFSQEEIVNVLKIVSSVLKLGNVGFVPTNNIDGTEGCTISNDYGMRFYQNDYFFVAGNFFNILFYFLLLLNMYFVA